MSFYPITIKTKLDKVDILNIDLFSLIHFRYIPICIDYWKGYDELYKNNRDQYEQQYKELADEKSKDTFRRLMDVRLNHNIESMSVFKVDETNQYFKPFLDLKEDGESFVDVGGFDGNTYLQFIKRCPHYNKIYFFEPEPDIMDLVKKNLDGNISIEYC